MVDYVAIIYPILLLIVIPWSVQCLCIEVLDKRLEWRRYEHVEFNLGQIVVLTSNLGVNQPSYILFCSLGFSLNHSSLSSFFIVEVGLGLNLNMLVHIAFLPNISCS